MNAQESGASALAGIALQLTLLDKLVEKGVLDADEVQLILLEADARLAQSPLRLFPPWKPPALIITRSA